MVKWQMEDMILWFFFHYAMKTFLYVENQDDQYLRFSSDFQIVFIFWNYC